MANERLLSSGWISSAGAGWFVLTITGLVASGIGIGGSVAMNDPLRYPLLLAGGVLLVVLGPYVVAGITREVVSFRYPFPVHILIPLTTLYLAGQAVFPNLERSLLWGEVFAFLLLPAIAGVTYRHPGQRQIIKAVYFILFVLPIFGTLYSLIFWSDTYRLYYLGRHLAIFQYTIYFFAAYRHAHAFLDVMRKFFWVPLILLTPGLGLLNVEKGMPTLEISLIGGLVLFTWIYLGFLQRWQSPQGALIGFLVLLVAFFLPRHRVQNLAVVLPMSALLPGVYFLRYWHAFVSLAWRRVVVSAVIIITVSTAVFFFLSYGKEIEENINLKISMMQFAEYRGLGEMEDVQGFTSTLWRVSLWAYLLNRFVDYPLGVGVGTPIFERGMEGIMNLVPPGTDVEYQSFMLSAHNSFIGMLVRWGVLFLISLVAIGTATWRMLTQYWVLCRYRPLSGADSRIVFGAVISFLVAVLVSSFNVVIETPLYAGLFWFSLGLMTRLVGDYVASSRAVATSMRASRQ